MGIITFFKKLFKRLFKHGGENNMPAGLQVFNKNGVQIVSLTDRHTNSRHYRLHTNLSNTIYADLYSIRL